MILIRRFRTTLEKKHKVSFINKNTSYDILEGDSIVTGSNNQGGKLPFSCMQGMCTTCIAKVIKGEFRYIEEPEPDTLSQEDIENNSIFIDYFGIRNRFNHYPRINEIGLSYLLIRFRFLFKLIKNIIFV